MAKNPALGVASVAFRRAVWLSVLLALALLAPAAKAASPVTPNELAITALSVAGTNLVLTASIPLGVAQVAVEMQTVLNGTWAEAGTWEVPPGVGEMVLTLPQPATATAFFRLRTAGNSQTAPLVSPGLQYVAVPSLGVNLAENGDAIFHFQGVVDGSERIQISHAGALWNHVNWGWPGESVMVNGHRWNPQKKSYLTTTGKAAFLPEQFSLQDVQLETIQGRDIIALERATNALLVYLDDTPGGADTYEFNLRFHPLTHQSLATKFSTRLSQKKYKHSLSFP